MTTEGREYKRGTRIKVKGGKALSSEQAIQALMYSRGSRGGLFQAVRDEIQRRIQKQETHFSIDIEDANGVPINNKTASSLVAILNKKYKEIGHTHRVRYDESQQAVLAVPVKLYESIFGKKS